MRRHRNAKIVATLGPASSSPEMIRSLFEAGADVFRLNFSHGTREDHKKRYDLIRAIERDTERPIGVLADLQRPKLRLGTFGDPALGGSTRSPIMTAYRQQALACAASLAEGPRRTREIRSFVPNASSILLRNVYGWFTRVERGVYTLTPEGIAALARWPQPVMAAVTSAGSRRQHRQHSAVPT